MSSASTVTYTSVYTDSEPGRVFWGADEELSDGGSPRVIVYGYDGLPMQPVAPPSPDYVPGPEHPPSPDYVPGPEHPPSPAEVPYVLEPEYHEFLVPSNDEAPWEDQPLPADASPIALSPGYVADSDPEEDPKEDPEEDHADYPADGGDDDDEPSNDDDDDDDTADKDEELFKDEEEEEHLAPANSPTIPIVDPIPSVGDTYAFKTDEATPTLVPSPRRHTAKISIRPEAPMPFPSKEEVERLLALPPPPPSPLILLSPPSAEERLARCLAAPALPSSPLPIVPHPYGSPNHVHAPLGFRAAIGRLRASSPSTTSITTITTSTIQSLIFPPHVPIITFTIINTTTTTILMFIHHSDRKEDIPEAKLPPHKRLCLTTLTSRYEVGESSTAAPRPTGGHRADYGFIGTMDADIRRQTTEEVGYGIRDVWEQDTQDIYAVIEDTHDRQTQLFQRVDGLGQLLAALGQIQALQARDQTHADDHEGASSSA
ncbi:hypothetical protein Tco_1217632 [Tanacetum coccineum]